jgi:HAE1 family hydrophobic/amphiphilic exporter-1
MKDKILYIIILYLFLHNFRATIVAAIAIPISLVATLIPIYFADFTLNIMSLMALAISVGVLVMNALVVLENIYRHMDKGETPFVAAQRGTDEIALAVTGSALTNVVVFLPIAFMSGITGQFFYQFGITVVFATIISLLVSFTITPILASKLCKKVDSDTQAKGIFKYFFKLWDILYGTLEKFYKFLVGLALKHRWVVIIVAILCFFSAKHFAQYIGSEMITESDRAQASITVEMPPGTNITETLKTIKRIENIVLQVPEVNASLSTIGKIEGTFGKNTEGVHVGEILLLLVDKNAREKDIKTILKDLRSKLSNLPAAKILVMQPSSIGGVEAPIQLEISGTNFQKLQDLSEKIFQIAKKVPNAVGVDTTWQSGKPEVRILPDRKKLSNHGINVSTFALTMRSYIEGAVAGQFREKDEEYDIRVKLRSKDRKYMENIGDMLIPLPGKGVVPVSHFSKIKKTTGPTQILRKNKQRLIVISMNAAGRSTGEIASDLDTQIEKIKLAPGYSTYQGGMIETMKESFADVIMAFSLAIILTYLVLTALLESYLKPFAILLTVPLSIIGVWIGLYLTNQTFNIFSMMALVMLVGIVVNNAILIIDYAIVLESGGTKRDAAMQQAATVRLRPILMTTLAAAFAMLPLALAWGWGAEMRSGMAVASIGGLLSSAALTLFVVPVVYTYLDDLKQLSSKLLTKLF